jgi:hypothetical protein
VPVTTRAGDTLPDEARNETGRPGMEFPKRSVTSTTSGAPSAWADRVAGGDTNASAAGAPGVARAVTVAEAVSSAK